MPNVKIGVEEEVQIHLMWDHGDSAKTIAQTLGVNSSTVTEAFRRLGIVARRGPKAQRMTEAQEQEAARLYREGNTAATIARLFGVNHSLVVGHLRQQGLRVNRGPHRKLYQEHAEKMVEMYQQGSSSSEIAETMGVDAGSIQRHLREQGVKLRPAGFQQGEGHHAWKGGRIQTEDGYILVLVRPDDPFHEMAQMKTRDARYCLEHRLVMAKHLDRLLTEEETVHHVDDTDRSNNDISNLQLRRGNHGKGAALQCADCGSHNIIPVPLASPTKRQPVN